MARERQIAEEHKEEADEAEECQKILLAEFEKQHKEEHQQETDEQQLIT